MALRMFSGADGRLWQVWDVLPDQHTAPRARSLGHLPPEMAGGWLCFETEGQKRRLCPVPADWWTLPDAEMEALCDEALPVESRRHIALVGHGAASSSG